MADVIILLLIAAYCVYLIVRIIRDRKSGAGCTGCTGCSGGSCTHSMDNILAELERKTKLAEQNGSGING